MKILKFKNKQKFKYNKKVIVKDLILLISVGIHQFEKQIDVQIEPERRMLN